MRGQLLDYIRSLLPLFSSFSHNTLKVYLFSKTSGGTEYECVLSASSIISQKKRQMVLPNVLPKSSTPYSFKISIKPTHVCGDHKLSNDSTIGTRGSPLGYINPRSPSFSILHHSKSVYFFPKAKSKHNMTAPSFCSPKAYST
jgi:hypothetical protein